MGGLRGRIAVVTGASAGIGAAVARTLAEAGATTVLAARRKERLDALAAELGGVALELDMADTDAPQRLLEQTIARAGEPDILVNNAGVLRIGSFETFDLDQLGPLIALNYASPVRASVLFARAMKAAGRGQIVNVSSIGAHLTAAGAGIYGGLKRALEIATDALRIELAGSGVKVGLVAPGTTSTEIFADMKASGQPGWDEYIPALAPEDVARAVLFMVEQSDRANVARVHVYSSAETF